IGVILSGSASDGTQGFKAIKAAGGITIAQDETAKFNSMPKSAISSGIVDKVLPPKGIAEEIRMLSRSHAMLRQVMKPDTEPLDEELAPTEDVYNIIQIIKRATGVDFSYYKINTMRRRMVRRMLLYKLPTLADYTNYIKQNPAE